MITLSLLQFLQDNGFGEIDKDLFWQKLALGKVGVYITDLGVEQTRGQRRQQRYELYSRGTSDTDGYERLKAIIDFLNNSYDNCVLPATQVGLGSNRHYTESYPNATIMPLSTPTNIGVDANGRVVWSASGVINY